MPLTGIFFVHSKEAFRINAGYDSVRIFSTIASSFGFPVSQYPTLNMTSGQRAPIREVHHILTPGC